MTTKEQERKALEQIRKIIEGLGEDSYIGTAFAGCIDMAEDNIDNDFANSMQGQRDAYREEANRACGKLAKLEASLAAVRDDREKAWDDSTRLSNENLDLHRKTEAQELTIMELRDELALRRAETIKLKAKLYDLMCPED